MSQTYTKEEVETIIKKTFYFSSKFFTGNSIAIDPNDIAHHAPEQDCLFSNLLGKALTILEIGLTGKQLEAAQSQIKFSFREAAKSYRKDYAQTALVTLDPKSNVGCGALIGDIKEILHN